MELQSVIISVLKWDQLMWVLLQHLYTVFNSFALLIYFVSLMSFVNPEKPDVHLHCEEWDQLLNEGNWEPEQITAKLPKFLEFLRKVQGNL